VRELLYYAIRIYELILIVRIFMSWIRPDRSNPLVDWVYRLTEPVLEPVRRLLPIQGMGIDFSPIIVFILLSILQRVILGGSVFGF
jgi:YggT family protein